MSGSGVEAWFEGQAAAYGPRSRAGFWSWLRLREERAVFDLLGPLAGRPFLDLAAGAGYYSERAARQGAASIAVDFSQAMLRAAAAAGVAASVRADLARLPFARPFDRILLAGGLEFVAEPAAVLREVGRLLAPEGWAVLLFPPDTWLGRGYRLFHRSHGLSVRLFAEEEMRALAVGAGLAVVELRAPHGFALVMRLVRHA